MFFKKSEDSEFLQNLEVNLNKIENFDDNVNQTKKELAVYNLITASGILDDIGFEKEATRIIEIMDAFLKN